MSYRVAALVLLLTIVPVSLCDNSDKDFQTTWQHHVHRLQDYARKYRQASNEAAPSGSTTPEHQMRIPGTPMLATEMLQKVRGQAAEALAVLEESERNISATCENHTQIFLDALQRGENWALRMFDAMGKPPSGLLDFHVTWLGSWEECRGVKAVLYEDPDNETGPSYPYSGQYCMAYFYLGQQSGAVATPVLPVLTLAVAMCLPDSCDNTDAAFLVQTLESLIPINTTGQPPPMVMCQPAELEYTGRDKAVLAVCGLFVFVMILASLYDVIIDLWLTNKAFNDEKRFKSSKGILSDSHCISSSRVNDGQIGVETASDDRVERSMAVEETTPLISSGSDPSSHGSQDKHRSLTRSQTYQPGLCGRLLLSFSVYTNAPKIFNTKQPAGTLTAVNGIRFISMTWVILGHTYSTGVYAMENSYTYFSEISKRLSFQAIGNATFSVDTFFVLSGLLVSYLSLKELKKRSGLTKFNWGMYYFHRFWRLTPPYMLVLLAYSTLLLHLADGPLWPTAAIDPCRTQWWHNLLYINNLVGTERMCMSWSWYLANDMQFFVISPLMIIPLYYSPLWGGVSCLVMVMVNFISAGLISKHYEFNANLLLGENDGLTFTKLYQRPWCRVGPYAVGVFTGYLLYRTDCKVKLSKIANMLGWLIAAALALLILYGLWSPDNENFLSVDMSALYNATSRTMWGVAVSWVVFACATGYGGPVNKLLSWPALIPLSRLTYCAYLVHPLVMFTYFNSQRALLNWYDLQSVILFMGNLTVSYAVAFVVSLAFEAPMMGLEKVIFRREKNS